LVSITLEQVRHIAKLANLEFTEAEYERFTRQLNDILGYVAQLERLDTKAIEATSHLDLETQALRDDANQGSISQDEALRNAPDGEQGLFKVPRVIG